LGIAVPDISSVRGSVGGKSLIRRGKTSCHEGGTPENLHFWRAMPQQKEKCLEGKKKSPVWGGGKKTSKTFVISLKDRKKTLSG